MADATDTTEGQDAGETPAPVPSDETIKAARKAKKRAALEKAREAKAAKAGAAQAGTAAPEKKENTALLLAGCRQLVRLTWFLARIGAWVAGGDLAPLTSADLEEGATEALPLARRFAFLALVLSFIGFPVWLFDKAAHSFKRSPPKQKAPLQLAPGPQEKSG